uniref:Uncharacterized protein n=1 Tax=Arundo donax TaxID=35708 RepID=A0A0A9DAU5_ARUDO
MTRSTSWSALQPLATSSIAFLFLSCIHLCGFSAAARWLARLDEDEAAATRHADAASMAARCPPREGGERRDGLAAC